MLLKDRVKLLRRDNEILAERLSYLEEALEEMNGHTHYLISEGLNNLRKEVAEYVDQSHNILSNKIDCKSNKELRDKYETALNALKYLRNYMPRAPLKGLDIEVFSYVSNVLLELGESLQC